MNKSQSYKYGEASFFLDISILYKTVRLPLKIRSLDSLIKF